MPSKKGYQLVENNEKPTVAANYCSNISWFVIITCSILSLFLVCLIPSMFFPSNRCLTVDVNALRSVTVNTLDKSSVEKPAEHSELSEKNCAGKYIYVLDLPSKFNTDFLENCSIINPWTDICKFLANSGLGQQLSISDESVFSGSNWYETDQFSSEVIFHNRMKQYRCLTNNYSQASAVFVPFYSGLDVGRYLWTTNATLRDATAKELAEFVKRRPEWKTFGGLDHFLIAGRITWDFSRTSENLSTSDGWGNHLLDLPEMRNMTSLLLEASPTSKSEIGIPYPTYFHPSSTKEVHIWQDKMRQKNRPYLFSFAGAPRPNMKESIRNVLIEQCLASEAKHCKFLHVNPDVKPETIMSLFQSSDFCLQPPGDSYTRKSTFDTILAGCIPVFFHPGSAYVHYVWHLPKNYSSYSMFIPMDELMKGNVSIEKRLLQIPKDRIMAMREEVIKLIPRIVYANPNSKVEEFEDAFEVAVKGVLSRVGRLKLEMNGVKNATSESLIPEALAWKYKFYGDLENHEWDKYFGYL